MSANPPPISSARFDQMFPALAPEEISRLLRFGASKGFAPGERIAESGLPGPGMVVILSGHVAITQRDGLGHVTPVIDHGPGQFLGEVGQLSGRVSLVDAEAEGEVDALVIPPVRLRELLIAEAELGERIIRALILRRVALIQSGVGGPLIIGAPTSPGVLRLQTFLLRNGWPHHLLDPATDAEAATLVDASPTCIRDLPWVVLTDGTVLHDPSEAVVARAIGMTFAPSPSRIYDVAVVGAGPAGLATAVYAASEGLSVAVLDAKSFGGQAGASARIENYLGFPTGITGQALAGRAYVQAQKFGAEILIPTAIARLDCGRADGLLGLEVEDGERILSRAVVVASGARYRRPDVPDLSLYEGRGIWYWASPLEARLVAGEEVIIVGGGNSAGQAAVFLSSFAEKVHILVRGPGLAESMSRYLVERIAASSAIELHARSEILALSGTRERGLAGVRWMDRGKGREHDCAARNVFLFVGADPATSWLAGCGVALDKAGFVLTGAEVGARHTLRTSVAGVFAVGDVRSGSVKRVGNAIGEGAQVVAALHAYLSGAAQPTA